MGVIYARINDELEKKFRIQVASRMGGQKGALSRAIEEAIELWINAS